MDSKQVTENLLQKKKAERIGLYENIWPQTLQRWIQEGYPKDSPPNEYFGFDINRIGFSCNTMPKLNAGEILEETDEWRVTRNGAGAALKYWKHRAGTPEHIDFLMVTPEIWQSEYRWRLLELDMNRFNFGGAEAGYKKYRDAGKWVGSMSSFIWETMRQSMGDMCMYESLADEPDWIHDFNDVYTNFYITHYKVFFEKVGIPDGIWISDDLGYKGGLFCSPDVLREMFLPYYKKFIDFIHSYGISVILHSCGGVEKALPFIIDAGFDALHPMERAAGCDPLKFADMYGDKLAFIGGVDKRVLESNDKELIKKEILYIMNGMKERGASYFFSSDHSLSTLVSYDSYKYAIEVYNDNKMYL